MNSFTKISIVLFLLVWTNLHAQFELKHPSKDGKITNVQSINDFRTKKAIFRSNPNTKLAVGSHNFNFTSESGVKILSYNPQRTPSAIQLEPSLIRRELHISDPIKLLNEIPKITGIKDPASELSLSLVQTDDLGIVHHTYTQKQNGIEVWGAVLKTHGKNGKIEYINGNWYKTSTESATSPTYSIVQAENIVKQISGYKVLDANASKLLAGGQINTKLVIYPYQGSMKLAYAIKVFPTLREGWQYFVDANNGSVIDKYSLFCGVTHHLNDDCADEVRGEGRLDGAVTANATDLNGVSRTLNTYMHSGSFYLIDASRTMFKPAQSVFPDDAVGVIWTLNGNNNSPSNDNFDVTHFKTNNNSWNSPASVSAHYNAGKAYEYFLNTHARNSINNQGGNVISLVNITEDDGTGMDNAFWSGAAMFYGNGKTFFFPLAKALDVAGHELSHGVVETTANLEYRNESGAMNESFADVFGSMIDRDDWRMGEDVVKPGQFPSGALRDLSNPHNGGTSLSSKGWQPAHMNEKYTGTQDNGGVHINSGITNFAYYKIATEISKEKAEKIFYRTLVQYLTQTAKFIDLRLGAIKSATDLYGANSPEVTAVKSGFDQVGILDGQGGTGSQTIPNNPGSDMLLATDQSRVGIYLGNLTTGGNFNQVSTKTIICKPSVSDDGSYAIFVADDKRMYALEFNWTNGSVREFVIQNEQIWRNVAISKDGSKIAAVTDFKENKIVIFDLDNSGIKEFTIKNPTTAQNVVTETFQYADALEFDHTGEFVMFDGFNKIQGTPSIEYWDIGFVYVWDNTTKDFADGFISKLFNGLPENVSLGDPVFSKNSPNIIAFDYIEGGEYFVLGANIESGDIGEIASISSLGYPCYSRTDAKLIFENNEGLLFPTTNIKVTNLATDKINKSGNPTNLVTEAKWGVWFSNGQRTISTKDLTIIKDLQIFPNPVTTEPIGFKIQNDFQADATFQILDVQGRIIKTGIYTNGRIDTSEMAPGIYFVSLLSNKSSYIGKLVKL